MKQRKKIVAAVIVSAVLAFFAGFSIGHEEGRKTQPAVHYPTIFYATITDVRTQGLEVEGLDINQINYRSLYRFSISDDTQLVWRGTPVELNELRPGLTVTVSFTGKMLETYPVGLTEVCRVEILDDNFR